MEAKIIYIEYRVLGNPISIRESIKTYREETGVTKRGKILKNLVILWLSLRFNCICKLFFTPLKMYVSQKISLQNQVLVVECCLEATSSKEKDLVKKLNIESANLDAKHKSLK